MLVDKLLRPLMMKTTSCRICLHLMSMLSERVVLKVLVMLAEWASAKSSTSIDDKIVSEIRSKLEADGKL